MRTCRDPRLSTRGLSFHIDGLCIVRDLSFVIRSGEVLGLIGPNGAGKTTTIDLLSGFCRAASGAVFVDGQNITRLTPNRRVRRGLVRTFQESPTVSGLSVLEHVHLAIESAGRYRAGEQAVHPDELLLITGLRECQHLTASHLPIAQRRMLDLARALATYPAVLLLDEPFAGLGKLDQRRVVQAIESLRDRGAAVLVVEHRLAQLNDVIDSAIVLVEGASIATGSLGEVLANPEVRRAYLGSSASGDT